MYLVALGVLLLRRVGLLGRVSLLRRVGLLRGVLVAGARDGDIAGLNDKGSAHPAPPATNDRNDDGNHDQDAENRNASDRTVRKGATVARVPIFFFFRIHIKNLIKKKRGQVQKG